MKEIDKEVSLLRIKVNEQSETIEKLVRLCDELRQPFNGSTKYNYLYLRAVNLLNKLEGEDKI